MGDVPGVQTILGDAGAFPEITYKGKVWRFGHPTQRAKAQLEELVVSEAVKGITSLKTVLPPQDYRELMSEIQRSISAGDYRTWGPGWMQVISTADGQNLFALSLLREKHPEATLDDVRGLLTDMPDETALAVKRVVPDFLGLLVEAYPTPLPPEKKVDLLLSLSEMMAERFARIATAA